MTDNGFFLNHEDYGSNISMAPSATHNLTDDKECPEHGTHVAGIIAAQNNTVGIRGIADQCVVECADVGDIDGFMNVVQLTAVLSDLLDAGNQVINCSWGDDLYSYDGWAGWVSGAKKDGTFWNILKREEIQNSKLLFSRSYQDFTESLKGLHQYKALHCAALIAKRLINNQFSNRFLFVQAAGNGLDNGGTGYDAKHRGYFCGIDPALVNVLNIKTNNALSNNGVTYQSIKEHILIVGSAKNNKDKFGRYLASESSNYGKTVEIFAPGEAVFSTVITETDKEGHTINYKDLSGTSMAAPMVTGSAALLWSLDPDLSSAQIKDLLINKTKSKAAGVGKHPDKYLKDLGISCGNDGSSEYPFLNIADSVKALGIKIESIPEWYEPDIAKTINEAGTFAWGWFYDNIHTDKTKTITRKTENYGIYGTETICELVTKPGINSKNDVRELAKHYFSADCVERLMGFKAWFEVDGRLYVSQTEGIGDWMIDSIEVEVEKISDTHYKLVVTKHAGSETGQPEVVNLTFVNGHWVLDRIFAFGEVVDITIIDRVVLNKESTSKTDEMTAVATKKVNDKSKSLDFEMKKENFEFKTSGGVLYWTKRIEYPYFKGQSSIEKKLNADYSERVQPYKTYNSNIDDDYASALEYGEFGSGDDLHLPYYENFFAEVTYNKNSYLSIEEYAVDWSGGGHPYTYPAAETYNVETGEEQKYSDFFIGEESAVLKLIKENFLKQYGEPTYGGESFKEMLDGTPFSLTSKGLCFHYYGGGAVPNCEVIIPYTESEEPFIRVG